MATFLVYWERFGKISDRPDELENWNECYERFDGPLHKTQEQARQFVNRIKTHPEYGKTRRHLIYKLVEVIK